VTSYTEGFSHFVTSMTAPVASGWSGCRMGLAPTGKRRLVTAHTIEQTFDARSRLLRNGITVRLAHGSQLLAVVRELPVG
jgi:hypothetical protein